MSARILSAAQLLLPELVVDSFAGGGGASTGIELALGRGPDLAINHNAHAVAVHQANHPATLHLCQDVLEVDPRSVCAGRRVGLFWASPDCTHFSRSKSGKPVSKKIRGLAWTVIEWAKTVAPRVIILENVVEFATWGPLDAASLPIKSRKGQTFRKWVAQLRAAGYQVEWQVLRASDYGVPSTRDRLFVIARNDGDPIVWPAPTHIEAPVAAREVLDIGVVAPTINPARRSRQLAVKTMERLSKGTTRYAVQRQLTSDQLVQLPNGSQAAVWIAKHFGGVVGHHADRPLSTITAVDHHGLVVATLGRRGQRAPVWIRRLLGNSATVTVDGVKRPILDIGHRMLEPHELAAGMGFAPDYVYQIGSKREQTARIGNAVCPPLAAALVGANYEIQSVSVADVVQVANGAQLRAAG